MRVLFLPWSTRVGGSESFVVRLSQVLRERHGADARVVALGDVGPLAEQAVAKGVPVAHLHAGTDWRLVANLPRVRESLMTMAPDVLVPLGYDLNLLAMLLPRPVAPVVVREAGGALLNVTMRGSGLRRHKITGLRRVFAGRVAGEVALSRHMLRAQQAVPHAGRLVCIPNGVDTNEFIPLSTSGTGPDFGASRRVVVVAAGRLIEPKGFRTLKAACERLAARTDRVVLLRLAGTGHLSRELADHGCDAPRNLQVEVLGHVVDMPGFWRSGHVAVVPSGARCHESFGLVAAEAMACGLPVVVTEVGALPEVVKHGATGVVVPPDDASAMSAALEEYVRDPDVRARHGRAARERAVRCYSLEQAANDYHSLLADVARAPS